MSKPQFTVQIVPRYLAAQSDPDEGQYLFAYTVTLRNTGDIAAQLISRHWVITDGNQRVEEVRGPGVVGEQPVLQPGQSFEYTSRCPLPTPVGTMRGAYHCVAQDGTEFVVNIAEFVLATPHVLH